ncbi:response regulator [Paenibacillus sp. HJGM_3]|uniref:response regulator n=1 Tax=Paenibacillus sp. HJGM_3 TaxID=3379816 RepID=UPI00385E57C0
MSKSWKVLVVDEHPLFAHATEQLLSRIERVEVVGVIGTALHCMDAIARYNPDIIFLDYQLPDHEAIEIVATIKKSYPNIHILIFTGKDIPELMNPFLELQVSGVLSKGANHAVIIQHVQGIMNNYAMVPLSLYHELRRVPKSPLLDAGLTRDEIKIMVMLVKGETHEHIAIQMHISKRSVDNYLKKIYSKLSVQTRSQAIEKFLQSDYYELALKGD